MGTNGSTRAQDLFWTPLVPPVSRGGFARQSEYVEMSPLPVIAGQSQVNSTPAPGHGAARSISVNALPGQDRIYDTVPPEPVARDYEVEVEEPTYQAPEEVMVGSSDVSYKSASDIAGIIRTR